MAALNSLHKFVRLPETSVHHVVYRDSAVCISQYLEHLALDPSAIFILITFSASTSTRLAAPIASLSTSRKRLPSILDHTC